MLDVWTSDLWIGLLELEFRWKGLSAPAWKKEITVERCAKPKRSERRVTAAAHHSHQKRYVEIPCVY